MSLIDNLGRFKKPEKAGQTPFTDTMDRCERLGYVPSHKRIAALISAGLALQSTRDQLFDIVTKDSSGVFDDMPPLPPIRRHLDIDLADLSQHARIYAARRRDIEMRMRQVKPGPSPAAGLGAGASGPASSPPGGTGGAPEGAEGKELALKK